RDCSGGCSGRSLDRDGERGNAQEESGKRKTRGEKPSLQRKGPGFSLPCLPRACLPPAGFEGSEVEGSLLFTSAVDLAYAPSNCTCVLHQGHSRNACLLHRQ